MPAAPRHRALAYILDDRWFVVVVSPAKPNSTYNTEPPPLRTLAHRELGPAHLPFPAASAGHRLVEAGYLIDPTERFKPDTINGWSKGNLPDQWQTVCHPITDEPALPALDNDNVPERSAAQLAADAAAAIRSINHALSTPTTLPYPPHVSEVAQPLTQVIDRLPETLDHLSTAIRHHLVKGLIRMDDATSPDGATGEALKHLGEARNGARTLSDSLHKAAAILFHMGTETAM
ncbi:hypothetical protein IAG44_20590 [Streptomyces roseirectus]|uniref:Uncharacterized protein n=1 Tax=Streptomyces roseirectus TaxID=2768066 RepID=A0A7H0IFM5_9ACTN|nr:hypothetical protein [Streptomyces roseirectus]QNP71591.1 hypothetical protein IAG44_20590 [Streptomyces roseirectus]